MLISPREFLLPDSEALSDALTWGRRGRRREGPAPEIPDF